MTGRAKRDEEKIQHAQLGRICTAGSPTTFFVYGTLAACRSFRCGSSSLRKILPSALFVCRSNYLPQLHRTVVTDVPAQPSKCPRKMIAARGTVSVRAPAPARGVMSRSAAMSAAMSSRIAFGGWEDSRRTSQSVYTAQTVQGYKSTGMRERACRIPELTRIRDEQGAQLIADMCSPRCRRPQAGGDDHDGQQGDRRALLAAGGRGAECDRREGL